METSSPSSAADGCLFLAEWEAARVQVHHAHRQKAEGILWDLQLRAKSGLAALDAWSAVIESRRSLEDAAACASRRASDELEARWQPLRVDAHDGEAAAWLVAAERAHARTLSLHSKAWAALSPLVSVDLKRRHQALVEGLARGVVASLKSWDEAHDAAAQTWQAHHERLQLAARAVADERAPPDSWLSEVRYRERARAHLVQQAAAEGLLDAGMATLSALELERASVWEVVKKAYSHACMARLGTNDEHVDLAAAMSTSSLARSDAAVMTTTLSAQPASPLLPLLGAAPPITPPGAVMGSSGQVQKPLPSVPDMPSASGAVLRRVRVAMQAPAGLFGLGGGGWREGATLVLTLHGYLHLFGGGEASASAYRAQGGQEGLSDGDEELVESAIKASVYVPMVTKCMFLRKGKELILDLSESESSCSATGASTGGAAVATGGAHGWAAAAAPHTAGVTQGKGGGSGGTGCGGTNSGALLRLLGLAQQSSEPVPRRVFARMGDPVEFAELESRCHEFMRRGQSRRSALACFNGEVTPCATPMGDVPK